jgi:hypothetical protein
VTFDERAQAVGGFGFTDRQSRFLVTVMTHSGVFLGRQYCDYCRISWGEPVRALYKRLEAGRFASLTRCDHGRTRLFHIQHKALYAAIGEADNRLRRPATLARAVERLIVLDAINLDRDLVWLGTEQDKVSYFTTRAGVPRDDLPALTFRAPRSESDRVPEETVRHFTDKLPIGVSKDGRTYVFVYVATEAQPMAFRVFLERHGALWRRLPAWTLRVVFPRHRQGAVEGFEAAFREQLLSPLPEAAREEMRWYFGESQRRSPELNERYFRGQTAFGRPRFRALFKQWMEDGDQALEGVTSTTLAEAVEQETARMESVVLPHPYAQLVSLVGTA